jgi:hypothetical protein
MINVVATVAHQRAHRELLDRFAPVFDALGGHEHVGRAERLVDQTQLARHADVVQLLELGAVAQHERDHKGHARRVGGLDHGLRLVNVARHDLFAHDMLARLRRAHRHLRVQMHGRADVHRVHLVEDRLIVRVPLAVRGLGFLPREFLVHVHAVDQFGTGLGHVGVHVRTADAATTDHRNSYFVHRASSI